ncbi:hypothetical protein EV175_004931 [Coemansia sp. RSA 1933]|nr:hypothetical protein EV175_004931 [Coemansia sp. RSA 1933]
MTNAGKRVSDNGYDNDDDTSHIYKYDNGDKQQKGTDLLRGQLDSVRSAIDTKDGDGSIAEDACANLAELEL